MSKSPTCEHIVDWGRNPSGADIAYCGKVANRRYPTADGGFMYLCIEHGKPHEQYAELFYDGETRAC